MCVYVCVYIANIPFVLQLPLVTLIVLIALYDDTNHSVDLLCISITIGIANCKVKIFLETNTCYVIISGY